jgi:V-type H+-transporting ATPase subunit A
LEDYYNNSSHPEFMTLKTALREILQQEEELSEIVQLVGKDSLSEDQKAVLRTAQIIKDEFLQQNSFSDHDYNCPLYKTLGMMKCIVKFHESCLRVILEEKRADRKISMAMIEQSFGKDILYELTQMKFKIPTMPEADMKKYFEDFYDTIEQKFSDLEI